MNIACIGTGYVGLVHGTVLADNNRVICIDKVSKRIDDLNRGIVPISEQGLEERIKRNVSAGRLKFSTSLDDAVRLSEILFICVGTPPLPNGSADVSSVFEVADNIAEYLWQGKYQGERLIVNKSTVPVGTTDAVYGRMRGRIPASLSGFDVAMNPEFLKEGDAVNDATHPDRIVIGVRSERAEKLLKALYHPFVQNGHPIIVTSPKGAELTKYGANGILATRLSFINELAVLCDQFGVNVREVLAGMTADARIGKKFAHPSGGYGGSCFPKDVKALVYAAGEAGVDLSVARATDSANDVMKTYLLDKVGLYYPEGIEGNTFAVWGLAFKSNTDDAREAPAVSIIEELLAQGAKVRAYDPQAMSFVRDKTSIGGRIVYAGNAGDALVGADALVICTEWPEFSTPDFEHIKSRLSRPVIFDNKSIFWRQEDLDKMTSLGFAYFGVGVENDIARAYRKFGK